MYHKSPIIYKDLLQNTLRMKHFCHNLRVVLLSGGKTTNTTTSGFITFRATTTVNVATQLEELQQLNPSTTNPKTMQL